MADKGKGTFIGSLWSRARSSSKSRSSERAADSPLRSEYSDEPDNPATAFHDPRAPSRGSHLRR
jgi:hypothetical protein